MSYQIDLSNLRSETQAELHSPPRTNLSVTAPSLNKMHGGSEVQKQTLLGPSVENMYRMSNLDTRVGDHNLYGSGPSVGNMHRMIDMHTRVGDQNLYGFGPCVDDFYKMSNRDARVGEQNLDGPGPSVNILIALDDLNIRAGDQNVCDSKPCIRIENVGDDLRSLVIPMNPLPAQSVEVGFRGEIDDQNLHGHQSPQSNPLYGGGG